MRPLRRDTVPERPLPTPRVLQFGGGNFQRAFLNWMLEEMNTRADFDGGAVLVKPTREGDYRSLRDQEGLFHVCLRGVAQGAPQDDFQLIRNIGPIIHPYRAFDDFLATAADPGLRLVVSNTTEAGLSYRAADRLSDRPAASFPGKLTQWLYHRYRSLQGSPESGCFVLPFELIEQNGEVLQAMVGRHARAWGLEAGFSRWLEEHNTFCNTLVDRIVPGFPRGEAAAMQERLGYQDACLVVAEPYHLLAIENGGELERWLPARAAGLNVHFTDDLGPYRTLKVRILNGAHTAMVPLGLLAGLNSVGEVMDHPGLGRFVEDLLREEVVPTLESDRSTAMAYVDATLDRFHNPFVVHRLADIALNTTAKVESRYLPSLVTYYEKTGRLPERLTRALAAMIRFYGTTWHGRTLPVRDTAEAVNHFAQAWKAGGGAATARAALAVWPSLEGPIAEALIPKLARLLDGLDQAFDLVSFCTLD